MELTIIFIIVVIHELGHYTAAKLMKWRIRRISLWVFGGVMETDEHASKPIKQELMITLAGPLQHVWIHFLILACSSYDILPESVITTGLQYNTTILFFNLLPIWPLDGGKLLQLFLSSILPFRRAHSLMIIVSICFSLISTLIFLIYFPFTLSAIMLAGFILWENRLEWKRRYYIFIRFLLKRHLDNPDLKRTRPIVVRPDTPLMQVFSLFKRTHYHRIHVKDKGVFDELVDERDCLHTYFKLKHYQSRIGELTDYR